MIKIDSKCEQKCSRLNPNLFEVGQDSKNTKKKYHIIQFKAKVSSTVGTVTGKSCTT